MKKENELLMTNIELEISNPCNENCVHCYRHFLNSKKGFLTAMQAENVLKQAKNLGAKKVLISGGESLLNPEWKEICKITEDLGLKLSFLTNGSLMTEKDADFFSTLKNLMEVQFSLYSLDENVHDSITKLKGSCKRTKKALKMLYERKIPIFISCPVMQENKMTFTELIRKMNEKKIPNCADLLIFGSSDYKGENLIHKLTEKDLNIFFHVAMENNGEFSYIFGESHPKNLSQTYFYGAAISSLLVSGDGTIYPMIGWYEPLGNIKIDLLEDIFYKNSLLQKVRKIMASNIPECMKCEASDFCTFCSTPHLTANHGELGKLDKNYCDYVSLIKKFAILRDKILKKEIQNG